LFISFIYFIECTIQYLFLFFQGKKNEIFSFDEFGHEIFVAETERGWMKKDEFARWFETVSAQKGRLYFCKIFIQNVVSEIFLQVIVPWAEDPDLPDGPKVVIVDNAPVHLNLDVVRKAKSLNVELIPLPPGTTGRLQPLDVGFFGPFKKSLRLAISIYIKQGYRRNQRSIVTCWPKDDVPTLLDAAMRGLKSREKTIQNAFKTTGLCPFDPEIALESELLLHTLFTSYSSCFLMLSNSGLNLTHLDLKK
jgi:hypothetical protein